MTRSFLITGGAGFIGSNYSDRILRRGDRLVIFDNLCRPGADRNLAWLEGRYGKGSFQLVVADVRDPDALVNASGEVDVIVHLASQVAVTTSVLNPVEDFEINARGTLNVLEAARKAQRPPVVLYASTNKVYGGMEDVNVVLDESRYRYEDYPFGVPETYPLDFHSPYGCSKGAGDQYVRDYFRIYGLPTVVMRMSCIYGPRQFGIEDQGWVAWMVIASLTRQPITIFGDGKQVRDLLHVEDLLNAYDAALDRIDTVAGSVYNLGGGPNNILSVWHEFGPLLGELLGEPIPVARSDWRPGDQRIFVADIRKAAVELGWKPQISVTSGIRDLFSWVQQNINLFSS
jgi:CDP-paratose 2-epimerase